MDEVDTEFKDLAQDNETSRINYMLLELYEAWIEQCVSKLSPNNKWTYPTLLKCTDSYLKNRTILYGKEENSHNTDNSNIINLYQGDDWPSFKYMKDIVRNNARKTRFLEFRKMFCLDYDEDQSVEIKMKSLSSVLVNNINKISENGQNPSRESVQVLYSKFTVGENKEPKTVFEHELDILEPKIIILACGSKYFIHIANAFSIEDERKLAEYKPTKTKMIQDISKLFRKYVILWTYHPGAFLYKSQRTEYNGELKKFINK